MRLKEAEFLNQLKAPLPTLSSEFESALFASAEALLQQRREFRSHRRIRPERWRLGLEFSPLRPLGQALRLLALQPSAQAAAVAVLVSIWVLFRSETDSSATGFSELPDFPRFNQAPARYDALWLAERMAYEKEIQDAHQETSRGI